MQSIRRFARVSRVSVVGFGLPSLLVTVGFEVCALTPRSDFTSTFAGQMERSAGNGCALTRCNGQQELCSIG